MAWHYNSGNLTEQQRLDNAAMIWKYLKQDRGRELGWTVHAVSALCAVCLSASNVDPSYYNVSTPSHFGLLVFSDTEGLDRFDGDGQCERLWTESVNNTNWAGVSTRSFAAFRTTFAVRAALDSVAQTFVDNYTGSSVTLSYTAGRAAYFYDYLTSIDTDAFPWYAAGRIIRNRRR